METKIDFKKKEKQYYKPSVGLPEIINIPNMNYLMVSGEGNPNSEPFQLAIQALYSLSYKIKMGLKKGNDIDGYYDWVVAPLEGIWDIIDGKSFDKSNKDNLKWNIMIRQPEFVKTEILDSFRELLIKKENNPFLEKVKRSEIKDGLCCQMMHIGSFDNEPETFQKMEQWCAENHFRRSSKIHREIYLSNFLKTPEEKLKTVLRCIVEKGA